MEKVIHYCWFGGKKKPRKLKKYIKTWKKFLPEYELMEWNEDNFDFGVTEFSKSAYEHKKWAFVADVARVYALKEHGGVYFDTDIEVTKNIDNILKDEIWLGREDDNFLATAMIGVKEKHNKHIENIFEEYKKVKFNDEDLYSITSPKVFTKYFETLGLKKGSECQTLQDDVHIYAKDYFNPKTYDGSNETFTDNTCIIHHFDATWTPPEEKVAIWFVRHRMGSMAKYVFAIAGRLRRIKSKFKK